MADIFSQWKESLAKTRKATFGKIATFLGATEITQETWEDLEAMFIQADLGLETTQVILADLKKNVSAQGITSTNEMKKILHTELIQRLDTPDVPRFDKTPTVILLVGVNGSGKTTTAAKLGKKFINEGKSVLLVAADTFRAAAVDQLQVLGERLDIPVIAGQPGGDPGAVTFDAIQSAVSHQTDIVLIDTAGRLHTRYNLMEELKKVYRVSGKALAGAPHAVWLVLDATTGQNALLQARAFKDAVNVDGIILAKLDSSARGGMAFAIQKELGLPIIFAGLGEKPEDLQVFDPQAFVNGILSE
jgi:fused signal recognition particle receptor